MMLIVMRKAHVKGYTRDNGEFVRPYETKKPAAKPKQKSLFSGGPKKAKEAAIKKPMQGGLFSGVLGMMESIAHSYGDLFPGEAGDLWGDVHGYGGKGHSHYKEAWKPKPKAYHPEPDDDGHSVPIYDPSTASGPETWQDPKATAVWTPGSDAPDEINGLALAPWEDHPKTIEGWDYVDGQMDDLDEPGMKLEGGKKPAAGVIIEEPDGRVWIVHPTNGYAGYKTTFPKGHAEEGLSLQASAIKECFEESGLKCKITGFVGDVPRGSTITRYYRAVRVGGSPSAMGWESQAVSLMPKGEVSEAVNSAYDKNVAALVGYGDPVKLPSVEKWKKSGPQKGSNPGGSFTDDKGAKWYLKFYDNPSMARNEVLAGKLYKEAGVRVPELALVEDDGKIGVASKMIAGVKQNVAAVTSGKLPGVYEGFAADAWLANWDVAGTGFDNLLTDGKEAVRIDVGGSLIFRAQGGPKGDAFGDTVGEVKTMRDPKNTWSYAVFKGITKADIAAGVKKIAAIPDDRLRHYVMKYGPGTSEKRDALYNRLVARRDDLIKRFL